ncbi:MAG: class I SAM-dependent methyltransferase [Pseudorhodoplanes sp.]
MQGDAPPPSCPACGGCFRRLYVKAGYGIDRCESCGLGRTGAQDFDPASYYTADYFSGAHADGYQDYRGEEAVLRREFARTVAFIRRFRGEGRLIEIGCAYGFFLKEAQPYFRVSGIELAREAAEDARRHGLDVLDGMADENNMRRLGMADVIVMLDVIEHVPDPAATLALCARYLNPGGILVMTTGDFGSLCARAAGRHWRLMTPPQHLWFFTTQSLRGLGEKAGLRLLAAGHPWKIVPLSLIFFQLRRMLGLRGNGQNAGGSHIGLPVNLFDAVRVVLQKPER